MSLIGNSESIFLIRDADYDPDVTPSGAIDDAIGHIAGSNGRLIVVKTTTAVVKVAVDVQVWDAPPTPDQEPSGPWEASREVPLWSHSGAINAEQLYEAPPPQLVNIALPTGAGHYTVRVAMTGRAALEPQWTDLRRRGLHLPFEEAFQLERQLDGAERYRLTVWPRPTP
ncbi:MAG TPA: hypothetical protein VES42_03675 [Pilimelia sp.]|nr:hypothetical protein [Pilimelia sp.]